MQGCFLKILPLSNGYQTRIFRKEITWKQFDERANRLANALITRGVGKGDRVLHWMMNSINWLEAYFGIVRTGAIATPLNFRFTERDFKYCADVAEPKAVILDEWFCDKVRSVSHLLGKALRDTSHIFDNFKKG